MDRIKTPHRREHRPPAAANNVRLVAKVARPIVRRDPNGDEGDLADAVKTDCARLRIPYDGNTVGRAVRWEIWKARHRCERGGGRRG